MAHFLTPGRLALIIVIQLYVEGHVPQEHIIAILSFIASHIVDAGPLIKPHIVCSRDDTLPGSEALPNLPSSRTDSRTDDPADLPPVSETKQQAVLERHWLFARVKIDLVTSIFHFQPLLSSIQTSSSVTFSDHVHRQDFTLWDLFLVRAWCVHNLDTLEEFLSSLPNLLARTREEQQVLIEAGMMPSEPPDNNTNIRFSLNSPIGLFIRRSFYEYSRLPFHLYTEMWKEWIRYRQPTATYMYDNDLGIAGGDYVYDSVLQDAEDEENGQWVGKVNIVASVVYGHEHDPNLPILPPAASSSAVVDIETNQTAAQPKENATSSDPTESAATVPPRRNQRRNALLNGISVQDPTSLQPTSTTISTVDIEELIEFQIYKISLFGCQVPPEIRQQFEEFLKRDAPLIPGSAYYEQFLERWKSGDFVRSLDLLHRFFDITIQSRDRSYYQYALLNLASLQADFHCYSDALHAILEAITTARENKDLVCLNYALYWIVNFSQSYPEYVAQLEYDSLLGSSEQDTISYLRVKAAETGMWSLWASTLFLEAKLGLQRGDDTAEIMETLVRGSHILVSRNQTSLGSYFLVQSAFWERLGLSYAIQQPLVNSMLLLQKGNHYLSPEETLRLEARYAMKLAQAGHFEAALQFLSPRENNRKPFYREADDEDELFQHYTDLAKAEFDASNSSDSASTSEGGSNDIEMGDAVDGDEEDSDEEGHHLPSKSVGKRKETQHWRLSQLRMLYQAIIRLHQAITTSNFSQAHSLLHVLGQTLGVASHSLEQTDGLSRPSHFADTWLAEHIRKLRPPSLFADFPPYQPYILPSQSQQSTTDSANADQTDGHPLPSTQLQLRDSQVSPTRASSTANPSHDALDPPESFPRPSSQPASDPSLDTPPRSQTPTVPVITDRVQQPGQPPQGQSGNSRAVKPDRSTSSRPRFSSTSSIQEQAQSQVQTPNYHKEPLETMDPELTRLLSTAKVQLFLRENKIPAAVAALQHLSSRGASSTSSTPQIFTPIWSTTLHPHSTQTLDDETSSSVLSMFETDHDPVDRARYIQLKMEYAESLLRAVELEGTSSLYGQKHPYQHQATPYRGFSIAFRAANLAWSRRILSLAWPGLGLVARFLNHMGEFAAAVALLEEVIPRLWESQDRMRLGTLYCALADAWVGLAGQVRGRDQWLRQMKRRQQEEQEEREAMQRRRLMMSPRKPGHAPTVPGVSSHYRQTAGSSGTSTTNNTRGEDCTSDRTERDPRQCALNPEYPPFYLQRARTALERAADIFAQCGAWKDESNVAARKAVLLRVMGDESAAMACSMHYVQLRQTVWEEGDDD